MLACLAAACSAGGPQAPIFPSGSSRAVLQLDAGDSGRTIGVESGALFLITLPVQQPDWRVTKTPDSSVASLVSTAPSGRNEVWTFRAAGPGTTDLELSSGAPEPFSLIVSVT